MLQGQLLLRSSLSGPAPGRHLRELALTTSRVTPTALVYADSRGGIAGSVPFELVQFVEHIIDTVHVGCNAKHLGSCFRIQTSEEEVECVAGSPAAAEEWCTVILHACEDLQQTLNGGGGQGQKQELPPQPQQQPRPTPTHTPKSRESKVSFAEGDSTAPAPSPARAAANAIAAKIKQKAAMTSGEQAKPPPPPPDSGMKPPRETSAMIERLASLNLAGSRATAPSGSHTTPTPPPSSQRRQHNQQQSTPVPMPQRQRTELEEAVVDLRRRLLTTRWRCAAALTRAQGTIEQHLRALSEQKRELAESHLQNKTMKAEMEKVFTERDILLEHSASLEVQIRTLIEEQAIREFHIQHGSPATTAAQLAPSHSQQPPPTSPTTTGMSAETKAALVAFSETGQIIEHGSDEANGRYSSRTNGAGGAGASLIDNIAVDEQEILFLKDRLGHTERELDRTLSELATSRREVESMRIEGHGRDREDMMRIACLNLDTRVPVFFGRVIHLDKVQGETIFHGHMRVRALVSQVASEFGLASQTLYTIRVCGVDVSTLNSDEPIGFAMPHALFANINNLSILVTPTGPEEEYM